ncbi:hypothetical protein [Solirhodobacter olei]|uniref:hypothetical protein n=1 Tax=Solirhodobacter olei TaxID=2493082 RepID=UPI000FDC946E|nr:hypothetical protein [Solirhodobacter olei]
MLLGSVSVYRAASSFLAYQNEHAHERQSAAAYYTSQSEIANQSCLLPLSKHGVSGWLACVIEKVSANQGDSQAQYDLKAQQDIAEWNYGSFLVGIFTFVLSIFGVGGVLYAIFQTNAGLRHASEANEISRLEQRPLIDFYLDPQCTRTIGDNGYGLYWKTQFFNRGKTAAYQVRAAPKIVAMRHPTDLIAARDAFVASEERKKSLSSIAIIFPGEKTPFPTEPNLIPAGKVDKSSPDDGAPELLYLITCTTYNLSPGDDHSVRGVDARVYHLVPCFSIDGGPSHFANEMASLRYIR